MSEIWTRRRSITLPIALYNDLAQEAARVNSPVQTFIVAMLTRAFDQELERRAAAHTRVHSPRGVVARHHRILAVEGELVEAAGRMS